MNTANTTQVVSLLNKTEKSASEMTQGLSILGDGRMADGLIALWKNGQKNGIIEGVIGTSVVFTVGIGLYALAKNKMSEYQVKQVIGNACIDLVANK